MIGQKIKYLYRQHGLDGIIKDKINENNITKYLVECGNECHIILPEDIRQFLYK